MAQKALIEAARRRGRPRAYDPEDALHQATQVFWRTGYSGTSLDQISAATQMNRPSLQAAFGDKHDLYLKALSRYWELKLATVSDALACGVLEESLWRVYEAALSIYFSSADEASGCFVLGTALTEAAGDAEIRHVVGDGLEHLDAAFAARFRTARDTGELAPDADVDALAALASATMHTIAVRARAGMPRDELEDLARKAIRVLCR